MTDHDMLARRIVTCAQVSGECSICDEPMPELCGICPEKREVSEPAEVTAERNARIAWWLAEHGGYHYCPKCKHLPLCREDVRDIDLGIDSARRVTNDMCAAAKLEFVEVKTARLLAAEKAIGE